MMGAAKKRILVVEDEKITAMDIRERLRALGYDPLLDVSTGEEAIQKAEELRPDLVLMDVVLRGGMDGVQTASRIKERFRIPVIFLTAFSDDDTLQRAKVTEPFGYILKPFEERELHTTVEMALYKHAMETDLRASEDKFAKAFLSSPDAININRLVDGKFIDVNNGFLSLTGYRREEVIGRSSLEVNLWVHEADRDRLLQDLKTCGEVRNLEAEFRLKDGTTRTGLMSATVINVGDEQCILSITRDISDRIRAHQYVRESQEQLDGIIRSAMDGIITVDEAHRVVLFNHAAEQMFGCSQQEAVGQPLDRFLPTRYAEVHGRHIESFAQSGVTGRSVRSLPSLAGLRSNGEEFPVEVSISQVEIRGQKLFTAVVRDNTEKKRAENALRQSELRYKEFFDRDLTGNFVAGVDGMIHDCNPAFLQIFGFSSIDDARHAKMTRLCRGEDQWLEIVRTLKVRNLEYHEVELLANDGRVLSVIENLYGEAGENGTLERIRGFIFDNTERKTLEQQLLHAQKMESVGTLASGIAHDFNNVLNNILGFAHQIKKYLDDPVKLARYADTIEKSAARGADLANQLMLFVRKKKRENVPVNIEEVVNDVLHLTQETFPKSIALEKQIAPVLMQVSGDRGELYQAVLNICLNARDAIVERADAGLGGTIRLKVVSVRVGDDPRTQIFQKSATPPVYCVEIAISDDGVGIPAAIREKVFDPFFTTKERGKGTGLGLSVVYNIIKNHGGTIDVESEPGNGTTFRILLPTFDPEQQGTDVPVHEPDLKANSELILLVDDEVIMQELGRELLEEAGYRVIVAKNGREAIDVYRERWKEIALVILDLVMPEIDGGQAYLQLRGINPALKAFFCTGYTQDTTISSLLEEHNLRALDKPFRPPHFLRTVREVLTESQD